jgi:hypothetical protein
MKKIFTILSLLTVLVGKSQFTYTWTNADGDNDFGNGNNWDNNILGPMSGPPSFGDNAFFDVTSTADCILSSDWDMNAILMMSTYTGTVDATGIVLNLVNLTQQAGTFLSPSGTLNISGNLTKSAPAFFVTSPTSILEWNLTSASQRNLSGSFNLATVIFTTSGSMGNRVVNVGASTSTCTSLIFSGASYPMSYKGTLNVTDALTISGTTTSAAPTNTGTVLFVGAGSKTITGTASPLHNPIGRISFNTTGDVTMSGNITLAQSSATGALTGGLWSVTNIGSFTPGTSTVTMIGGTITAGNGTTSQARFDNLTIQSGSTTVLTSNSFISLTKDLIHDGTITANNALFRLTGTGNQNIAGSSTLTALNAIEVAGAGTKVLGHLVQITDSVKVGTGNLICGGNLTLKSTAGLKGRIAQIIGGGAVSGNVNVETFLPGGTTGWANLCSPGVTGQTMANWNGSGIAMTCSLCPYTQVGGTDFESVLSYDETLGAGTASNAAHYIGLSSGLGDAIDVTKGYWVYLGDSYPSSGDITPVLTGSINQGNSFGGYNLSLTGGVSSENGWNLISNPYPAPVSLTKMFAGNVSNIDNIIQVWNTDLNGGAGDWAFYTLGGATDAIPMGQGFMVRALTNGVTLTGSESWKTVSNASVQKSSNNGFDYKDLFKLNLTGSSQNFDTYTYFDFSPNYSNGFDNGRDAYALDNASNNSIAQIFSKINTDAHVIAALPMPAFGTTLTIPIHVPTGFSDVYTINPMNVNKLSNYCVSLVDLSNNSIHDVQNGAYTTTIAANNGSAPRFNLLVSNCGAIATTISSNLNQNGVNPVYINKDASGVFVKLDLDKTTKTTISVTNILGQKIIADKIVNVSRETVYLDLIEKNQLLLITVTNENGKVTKKLVH